ncbi:MAG: hypothetical protein BWY36_00648 [Candidatus Diapherotrites archaeon ADurb.Bin253]|nr:MAG: hypothetical protein BWY36_00648 [Candidatus Diapherotrites archaeon ADurb.Bin253]
MEDKHLNLFYCYERAEEKSRKNKNKVIKGYEEISLENNVTRAFIILLKHCPKLLKKFLNKSFKNYYSAPEKEESSILREIEINNPEFFIQERLDSFEKIKKCKKVLILGISPEGKYSNVNELQDEGRQESSIFDAGIFLNDTFILIENKTVGGQNKRQIERYVEYFKSIDKGIKPQIFFLKWSDFYGFLENICLANEPADEKEKFIREEFKNFLKIQGVKMTGFKGYCGEDFDVLYCSGKERPKEIENIRGKINEMANLIAKDLGLHTDPRNFDGREFGIVIGEKEQEIEARNAVKYPNFYLGLNSENLYLQITIEGLALSERFIRKMQEDESFRQDIRDKLKNIDKVKLVCAEKFLSRNQGNKWFIEEILSKTTFPKQDFWQNKKQEMENRREKTAAYQKAGIKFTSQGVEIQSIFPVFAFRVSFNRYQVEKEKNIKKKIKKVLKSLIPLQNFLRENI